MRSVLLFVVSGAALHSNHQSAPLLPQPDRRLFIRALASTAASVPAVASAERTGLLDVDATGLSLGRAFELSLPKPELPRANRAPLDQKFAVCMMRSSYNTVDELDFCAMDAFQKRFFLIRQDEWQPYLARARAALGRPPEQGDLTDPLYFDFISFAQYETINDFLKRPRKLFEELVSAEGETRVVARNASSVADDRLRSHAHVVTARASRSSPHEPDPSAPARSTEEREKKERVEHGSGRGQAHARPEGSVPPGEDPRVGVGRRGERRPQDHVRRAQEGAGREQGRELGESHRARSPLPKRTAARPKSDLG